MSRTLALMPVSDTERHALFFFLFHLYYIQSSRTLSVNTIYEFFWVKMLKPLRFSLAAYCWRFSCRWKLRMFSPAQSTPQIIHVNFQVIEVDKVKCLVIFYSCQRYPMLRYRVCLCCLSMFWEESYEDTRTRGEGKRVQGIEKGSILVIVLKPVCPAGWPGAGTGPGLRKNRKSQNLRWPGDSVEPARHGCNLLTFVFFFY